MKQKNLILNTLVLYGLIFFSPSLNGQESDFPPRFRNISDLDGLAQNTVYSIFQDDQGFMWFGTQNGLNRYDGWDFVAFKVNLDNATKNKAKGLSSNNIRAIIADPDSNLWVGTDKGIDILKSSTEEWYNPLNDSSWNHGVIQSMLLVNGHLLITAEKAFVDYHIDHPSLKIHVKTTFDGNANVLLPVSQDSVLVGIDGKVNWYLPGSDNPPVDSKLDISSLSAGYIDDEQQVWLGTNYGDLYSLSEDRQSLIDTDNKVDYPIQRIIKDDQGRIWVAQKDEGGITIFDGDINGGNAPIEIKNDLSDPRSLVDNTVLSILKDRNGSIWIGTRAGGISKYDRENEQFYNHMAKSQDPYAIRSNFVWAIEPANANTVWVGTNNGILNKYNTQNNQFETKELKALSGSSIQSLRFDSRNWLWLGTESRGLFVVKDPFAEYLKPERVMPSLLGEEKIKYILEDSRDGSIWLATKGQSVLQIGIRGNRIISKPLKQPAENNPFRNEYVYTLHQDVENPDIIYLGQYGNGLFIVDSNNSQLVPQMAASEQNANLRVLNICPDPIDSNLLWLATSEAGVKIFDKTRKTFVNEKRFGSEPQLVNTIYSIIPQDTSAMWLSTRRGVLKYDFKTQKFENYGTDEGLDWLEFNAAACAKDDSGHIYFGSFKGMLEFDPDLVHPIRQSDSFQLTQLEVEDEKYEIGNPFQYGENSFLKFSKPISEINLSSDQTSFRLSFSNVNYSNLTRNSYLKGELIYRGSITTPVTFEGNTAAFLNLNRGPYRLQVYDSRLPIESQLVYTVDINIELKWFEEPWVRTITIAFPVSLTILLALLIFSLRTKSRLKETKGDLKTKERELLEAEIVLKTKETELLESQVAFIQRRVKLRELINKASVYQNNENLVRHALKQLVSSDFFGFKYAFFYEANYYYDYLKQSGFKEQAISTQDSIARNFILLPQQNSATHAVINNEYILDIDGETYQLSTDSYEITDRVRQLPRNELDQNPKQYEDIAKVFFPIVRLINEEPSTLDETFRNYSLGVIECGISINKQKVHTDKLINPGLLSELALYTDNLALPYFRNSVINQDKVIDSVLTQIREDYLEKSEDFEPLLKKVLENLVIAVNGVLGVLTFTSMKSEPSEFISTPYPKFLTEQDKSILQKRIPDRLRKIQGETYQLPHHEALRKTWFIRGKEHQNMVDPSDYQDYFDGVPKLQEVLLIPMIHMNYVIGIVKIYANSPLARYKSALIPDRDSLTENELEYLKSKRHFNWQKVRYAHKFVKKSIALIRQKKHNYFLSEVARPLTILEGQDHFPPGFILILQRYFHCEHVSIWTKKEGGKYGQTFFSKSIKKTNSVVSEDCFPTEDFQLIEAQAKGFNNLIIDEIEMATSDSVKAIFKIQIRFHQLDFGFIQLYLNRSIAKSYIGNTEEVKHPVFSLTKDFLRIISNKISESIQINKIIELVTTVGQEATNLDKRGEVSILLNRVMKRAQAILNAQHIEVYSYADDSKTKLVNHLGEEIQNRYSVLVKKSIESRKFQTDPDKRPIACIPLTTPQEIKGVLLGHYEELTELPQQQRYFKLVASLITSTKTLVEHFIRNTEMYEQNMLMMKPIFEGVLISGAIHDLSTNLQEINREYEAFKQNKGYKGKSNESYRALHFVKELEQGWSAAIRDLERLETYWKNNIVEESSNFDLNEVLLEARKIIEDYLSDKRVVLHLEVKENVTIRGERDLIRNVIVNLLKNACEAIEKRGNVWVKQQINRKRSYCIIRIEDDGPGIDQKIMSQIFDPYFTTKGKGTGLGLAMSKAVVDRHQGKLIPIKNKKSGAALEIWLPGVFKEMD